MELRTKKASLRGKIMGNLMRSLVEYLAKKGKDFYDPMLIKKLLARKWHAPKGYTWTKHDFGNFKLEIISKQDNQNHGNAIYYLHGGGYAMPLTNNYRSLAVKLSKLTQDSDVILLDYRIAPKHTYPAALEDAEEGWERLSSLGYMPEKTTVFGESAGGNLSIALTAKLRDSKKPMPMCVAVMSAWTDLAGAGRSYRENINKDPLFGINKYVKQPDTKLAESYAGNTPLDDPGLSPVYGSFEDFPPMLMQAGTYEMLYSDTEQIYHKAKKAGVKVMMQAYHGMFHVFQMFGDFIPEGKIAWREVGGFISEMQEKSCEKKADIRIHEKCISRKIKAGDASFASSSGRI